MGGGLWLTHFFSDLKNSCSKSIMGNWYNNHPLLDWPLSWQAKYKKIYQTSHLCTLRHTLFILMSHKRFEPRLLPVMSYNTHTSSIMLHVQVYMSQSFICAIIGVIGKASPCIHLQLSFQPPQSLNWNHTTSRLGPITYLPDTIIST